MASVVSNLVLEGVGGIQLLLGYALLLIGLVIAGVVLLIVKRKKLVITHAEEDLPKVSASLPYS